MTSSNRTLIGEALSWAIAAVLIAWVMANFEDVKAVTADLLGIERPASDARNTKTRTAGHSSEHNKAQPIGYVELLPNRQGHYETELEINGRRIGAMIDTGATLVALSHEDAGRAGIRPNSSDYTHRVRTANGIAKVAPVTLSRVRVGDITIRNVAGVVSEPGAMKGTLLGMSFLSRLSRFEIRDGRRLVLQE